MSGLTLVLATAAILAVVRPVATLAVLAIFVLASRSITDSHRRSLAQDALQTVEQIAAFDGLLVLT